MAEKQKKHKLDFGSGPGTSIEEDTPQAEGSVSVIHGVYAHDYPFVGMTVKQARAELTNKMNIDPTATAVVDGNEVGDDVTLTEGVVLSFIKASGEKGFLQLP